MSVVLSEHLSLLAAAPDGIQKLRRLILELAVRGKLVPQDPNDEPAGELLKQISNERVRLEAEGKTSKSKPLPPVRDGEQPYELPENWLWSRLGQSVIESGAGWSPNCEARPRENNEWGVLKVSAISWGTFNPAENKALPVNLKPRPEHEVVVGDFLVSRANTAELVARSVVVDECPRHLMLSDKIVRLKLSKLVSGRFINIANSCFDARSYYAAVAGGTSSSMKNVSREQILNLAIPLPPLAEQHRIVSKVDELMALCYRLEAEQMDAEAAHARLVETLLDTLTQSTDATELAANWQRLAEHFDTLFTTESSLDALKQTILQLAVMGKLVPQDSSGRPMTGVLGDFVELLNGYAFKSEWFSKTGVRLLRNANVAHGHCDWTEAAYTPIDRLHEFKKFELTSGDLVLSLDRPIINTGLKLARVSERDLPCLLLQRVAKVFPRDTTIETNYLFLWFNSFAFTRTIDPGRSNGVPHISTKQIAGLPFIRFSINEQRRIVAKAEELMALCDRLKADLAESRNRQARLSATLIESALQTA
ncbi:restriction endonuclease subunit S [Plasticicumulans sp.]|uniref:restriction endonuclease subunit S n=1 Tax=Plasticicumulans sp. TaxID=2307179 RepID=UPI0039365CD1